jgi:broad specificity phosphatase PhoE
VRLILIRHGQSEGNAKGVLQGRLDFGLSELGRIQARATAERLATGRFDRLVTSPLRRAYETAEALAAAAGLPIEPEPGLMEYDLGEVSGLSGAEMRARYPEIAAAYARRERPRFPGEEGRDVFQARVRAAFEALRDSGQDVVAVAHGGVISAICYAILGVDAGRPGLFEVANCSITEIVPDRTGRAVIRRHNDTCHLDGLSTRLDLG